MIFSTRSSGGIRRGGNLGGNFSAERLSGEPVGSFLQLFKNIFPLFRFFFTKNVFDQKFFELKFWDLNFCWSEILDNKFLNLQFSDPKYCLNSNIFFGLQFFLDLFQDKQIFHLEFIRPQSFVLISFLTCPAIRLLNSKVFPS